MAKSDLIEPALLHRLERLSLNTRNRLSATDAGDRVSRRRGLSIEFSDYRDYRPGDDLRYVDWKAYGRLEKVYLKLFQDEEDLSLHLLIDSSKSMDFGRPMSKWVYARRAAAAIGFVALHGNHRVDAASFSTHLAGRIAPLRGDVALPNFLSSLDRLPPPTGETDFPNTVRQYSAAAPPAGIVIVFSDFYDPSLPQALSALAGRRHDVTLVQVLDPQEVAPDLLGDFSLTDSETGAIHEVTLTDTDLAAYHARFVAHQSELRTLAQKFGMNFIGVNTHEPLEELVLGSLRRVGMLR